jgi:hypothetical protein
VNESMCMSKSCCWDWCRPGPSSPRPAVCGLVWSFDFAGLDCTGPYPRSRPSGLVKTFVDIRAQNVRSEYVGNSRGHIDRRYGTEYNGSDELPAVMLFILNPHTCDIFSL